MGILVNEAKSPLLQFYKNCFNAFKQVEISSLFWRSAFPRYRVLGEGPEYIEEHASVLLLDTFRLQQRQIVEL